MAKTYTLETIERETVYTLSELCERKCLETEFVVQCVDYGIAAVKKEGRRQEEWLFPVEEVPKLEKAFRLHHDLDLDFNGLAIVLDLLDDIETLHERIDRLDRRLRKWEPE